MNQLSNRITNLKESATLKMAALARELKGQGKDVISLSLGEPDFDTPAHIVTAAKKAMDDGHTHYPPVSGYADVREAIAAKFKRDNQLNFDPAQIVVSTGAKQTLANLMLSLVNPGDEVVIPIPYWVSYAAQVELAEGKLVEVNSTIESDFKITADQLDAALSDKTKVFLICSPCNPSGSVYSKTELAALVAVLEKYPNVVIISDEIYEHITFEGQHESIAQFDSIRERVVIVNGLSKAYAMTGWRLGYMAAPLWIAKGCSKMQGQFTSGANSITQKATIAALLEDQQPTQDMKAEFLRRRDMLLGLLRDLPGFKVNTPTGAFYVFPDVSSYFGKSHDGTTLSNADDFCMYLLEKANVSLVTGSAFGAPSCVRISYAASEEKLREAVNRIAEALAPFA